MNPSLTDMDRRRPSRLDWIIFCIALVVLAWAAAAHSAEARPRRSLAACEARIDREASAFTPDAPPAMPELLPAGGVVEDEINARRLADYREQLSEYHPLGTREFMVKAEKAHYCHGVSNGIGDPIDRTVTFTGKVYYDGTVTGEIR